MYEYHQYEYSDYDNAEGKQIQGIQNKINSINYAHATSAGVVLEGKAVKLEVTEGRNVDTHLLGSFQNGSTPGHFHFSVVYS